MRDEIETEMRLVEFRRSGCALYDLRHSTPGRSGTTLRMNVKTGDFDGNGTRFAQVQLSNEHVPDGDVLKREFRGLAEGTGSSDIAALAKLESNLRRAADALRDALERDGVPTISRVTAPAPEEAP